MLVAQSPKTLALNSYIENDPSFVTRLRENEMGEETSKPSYQRGTPRKLATHALTKAHLNIPNLPAVTAVQPVASAGPSFQAAIRSGKFQGMICPTTPTGA